MQGYEPRRRMPGPWRLPARTVCGCRSTMDTKFGSSADCGLFDREAVDEMRLHWTARGAGVRAAVDALDAVEAAFLAHWRAVLAARLLPGARRFRSRLCVQFMFGERCRMKEIRRLFECFVW